MPKKILKKALVMTLTDASSDPRPLRYIQFLTEKGLNVDLLSYPLRKKIDYQVSEFIQLPTIKFDLYSKIKRKLGSLSPVLTVLLPFKKLTEFFIRKRFEIDSLYKKFAQTEYDIIVVQDLYLLPLAFSIKKSAKILFDAREYYPSQNEENLFFRLFERPERIRLCRDYLHQCDQILTVSYGLKKKYESEFDVYVEVFQSIPNFADLQPSAVDANNIKLVHHGAANRNRQIEKMIEIVKRLDNRYTLDLYLKGETGYIKELEKLIKDEPRIKIKDPVAFEKIIETINKYDVGLFYVEPTTFNLKHCLPNKLFEFIQARLMVAIGPSPDMSKVVYGYYCGVVSKEFTIDSMTEALTMLSIDEVQKYKQNSHKAASILCFEKEKKLLSDLLLKWSYA